MLILKKSLFNRYKNSLKKKWFKGKKKTLKKYSDWTHLTETRCIFLRVYHIQIRTICGFTYKLVYARKKILRGVVGHVKYFLGTCQVPYLWFVKIRILTLEYIKTFRFYRKHEHAA